MFRSRGIGKEQGGTGRRSEREGRRERRGLGRFSREGFFYALLYFILFCCFFY
jgi:hypothetical protein